VCCIPRGVHTAALSHIVFPEKSPATMENLQPGDKVGNWFFGSKKLPVVDDLEGVYGLPMLEVSSVCMRLCWGLCCRQWNKGETVPVELEGVLAKLKTRKVDEDFQMARGNLAMMALGLKHQDTRTAPDTRLDGRWVKRGKVDTEHTPRRTEERFLAKYGDSFDPYRPVVFAAWPRRKLKRNEKRNPLQNADMPAVVCFQVAPVRRLQEEEMDPIMRGSSACVLITAEGEKKEPGTFSMPVIPVLRINYSREDALRDLRDVIWSLVKWRAPTPIANPRALGNVMFLP